MKTNEFIEKVKDLGYGRLIKESEIIILCKGWAICYVSKDKMYSVNPIARILDENDTELLRKLFELAFEYASTPINEREEEVKYYLRQRPILYLDSVLNYGLRSERWFYSCKTQSSHTVTEFTEKEIEKLGYKLSDFAYCVVGTDEWLNTGVENE